MPPPMIATSTEEGTAAGYPGLSLEARRLADDV
jgi:hypothetical protein